MGDIMAVRPGEKFEYILPSQMHLPEEEQIVWELATLNYRDRMAILKYQRQYDRVNRQAFKELGFDFDKLRELKMAEADPEKQDKAAQLRAEMESKFTDTMEDFSLEKLEELEDLTDDRIVNIAVDYKFIEACLGTPGKPKGLIGWRNWIDAEGNEIEYDSKTYLDILPGDILVALSMKVYDLNTPSQEVKKK